MADLTHPVSTRRVRFFFVTWESSHDDFGGSYMTTPLLKLGGLSRVTGVPGPTLLRWWDRNTIESCRFELDHVWFGTISRLLPSDR